MIKKIKSLIKRIKTYIYRERCYSAREYQGYAAMGSCAGLIRDVGDIHIELRECRGCPHFVEIKRG